MDLWGREFFFSSDNWGLKFGCNLFALATDVSWESLIIFVHADFLRLMSVQAFKHGMVVHCTCQVLKLGGFTIFGCAMHLSSA